MTYDIFPVTIDLQRTEIMELGRKPPPVPRPIIVSRIVIFDYGNLSLLMGKSKESGLWEFPGGKLEHDDEGLVQGGLRELREETGITAKGKGYEAGYFFGPGVLRPGNYLDFFFTFGGWNGTPAVTDDGKHSEWRFFQTRSLPLPNWMMPSSAYFCFELLGKPLTKPQAVIDLTSS